MTALVKDTSPERTHPASQVPNDARPYGRTAEFNERTVPPALTKSHSTKSGTWGLIHVLSGELLYRIVDPRRAETEVRLCPGQPGVVELQIEHEVQPVGPVSFFVEFLRIESGTTS